MKKFIDYFAIFVLAAIGVAVIVWGLITQTEGTLIMGAFVSVVVAALWLVDRLENNELFK